jgi:O-antigen/teichoic acid export membrane protein
VKATQRISGRLVFQLDRLVVGAFAPIAAVAYYAVPLSLSQRVMGLVGNVGTAVFPAASSLAGEGDQGRIEELYLRSMKLTALLALPTSSILFIYAHEIMRYWLSRDFEASSSGVLMILAAANLLFAATTVPALTLDAVGRIRVSTAFGLSAAVANVILVFGLVPTIGFRGAAWAVLANAAVHVPLLLYYVHTRIFSVTVRDLLRLSLGRPFLAAVVLWPAMIWARQYATNLAFVALLCVGTVVAYVGLTVLLGSYDARDRALVRSFARR